MPQLRTIPLIILIFVASFAPCLGAPVMASGQLLAPGGIPLAGVELRLVEAPTPTAPEGSAAVAIAHSDQEGRFALSAPSAGIWAIRVHAEGFVPSERLLTPLVEALELDALTLVEDHGLEVRVVDEEGVPVAGARVQLGRAEGRIRFDSQPSWTHPPRYAYSDEDGRAHLPRARGEDSWLSASATGYAVALTRRLRGNVAVLRLVRSPKRVLKIIDRQGEAVEGAVVRLTKARHLVGRSGKDGTVSVPGGTEEIAVRVDSATQGFVETRLPPSANRKIASLELPGLEEIVGRVIDAETRQGIEGSVVWVDHSPSQAAQVDAGGRYRLLLQRESHLTLRAGAPGYLPNTRAELTPGHAIPPTLALIPGAVITGRISDTAGRPLPGATVALEIHRSHNSMTRIEIGGPAQPTETVAGRDGYYHLGPIDPARNWRLISRMQGFAPTEQTLAKLTPYELRKEVNLTLEPGLKARGLVTDSEGRPLAEAALRLIPAQARRSISVFMPGDVTKPAAVTISDQGGHFSFEGLRARRFDLEASHRGFATKTVPGIAIDPDNAPLVLEPVALQPGTPLTGWVFDEAGEAIEGATISLSKTNTVQFVMGGSVSMGEADALSGPDGFFRIDDLTPGEQVDITAERGGYIAATQRSVALPIEQALTFTLVPSLKVSGLVIDTEGQPLPSAQVTLTRTASMKMGGNVMMMKMLEGASCDADGRFVFEGLEPGKISLGAAAPGMQEATRTDLELIAGKDLEDIELTLEQGAYLAGRILLPDGRPAIGARIAPVIQDADPMPLNGSRSDGDGRYLLDSLTPGIVSIEATLDDGLRAVREIELREGANELEMQFPGGHAIAGRVIDDGGAPIEGAFVRLAPAARPWGGAETISDTAGSFRLEGIRDGAYLARVSREGYAAPLEAATVTVKGEDRLDLELQLSRGGSIEGRITGLEEPLFAKLRVVAFPERGDSIAGAGVDHEGRFIISDLAPGRWSIEASVDSRGRRAHAQVKVGLGAPATVTLEFGGGFTLSGRALIHGAALDDAIVNLKRDDGAQGGWARTDGNGRFAISEIEPGSYELELRQWSSGLSYEESVEIQSSREIEIEIPLASVAGRVVDAFDHAPVPGVSVSLLPASGDAEGMAAFSGHGATSDLDGHFRVSNVTAGEWTLRTRRKGYAATSRPLTLVEGRDSEPLEIVIDPTEGLVLDLRLASGGVPEQVRLALLDEAGAPIVAGSYRTGEGGRLRLTTAPAGDWRVVLGVPGSGTIETPVHAPGPPAAIVLPGESRLEVIVPELVDEPAAATLRLVDEHGRWHREIAWLGNLSEQWRLARGRAFVAGLPPGRWTAWVDAGGGRRWTGEVTTRVGETMRLELDASP